MNTSSALNLVPRREHRRSGLGLLEMLLVMAVAALILGAVMRFYSDASSKHDANETVAEVVQLVSVVHQVYGGQRDYSGLTTSSMLATGLFPKKYLSSDGSTIVTPGGGIILGLNGTANPGSVINFWIYGASRTTCIEIATADWGDILEDRNINGNSYSHYVFSPVQANEMCLDGNSNQIGFNFY